MKRLTGIISLAAAALLAVSPGAQAGAADAEPPAEEQLQAMTAVEVTERMGIGTNLGNTFEAYGHPQGTGRDPGWYETLWGQPVTTREMIRDLKAAGVTTVRIPVAWTNAMAYETGDYTIDPKYLARVGEVIDWCLDEGMFVIVNDHWDGGWWGMFGSAKEEDRTRANDMYAALWTQVAQAYGGRSYRLIFEGANEELGNRLNDADVTGAPGVLTQDECYAETNRINQLFVNTVRATGGKNADRFLLIPGYNTDYAMTLDPRFRMPEDTAQGKLFLSVHYYTPWSYCGGTGDSLWGNRDNYEEMNGLNERLSVFRDKGYGVIIGECGVLPTAEGALKTNHMLWFRNFYDNCRVHGFVPCLWDTSSFYIRGSRSWVTEEFRDFITSRGGVSAEDARAEMDALLAEAPESFSGPKASSDEAVAWIMWNSADWAMTYSVGDAYDPDSKTLGLAASDTRVTGWGRYTVSLDFTGTDRGFSNSTAFSAIGLSNGEARFPGYSIDIREVKVNGEAIRLRGRAYTTSDDGLCTRVNLFNEWVTALPADARTRGGGTTGCSPTLLDKATLGEVRTIEITFDYIPGPDGASEHDARRGEKPAF